jgi:hypothetical protein
LLLFLFVLVVDSRPWWHVMHKLLVTQNVGQHVKSLSKNPLVKAKTSTTKSERVDVAHVDSSCGTCRELAVATASSQSRHL